MTPERVLPVLLRRHGRTYAAEAGIDLHGGRGPLFALLCLSLLLSARVRAGVATAAARALMRAGWDTPEAMAASTWAERTAVLNRVGYARYDESTSRMLGECADLLISDYAGDPDRIRADADRDPAAERRLLQRFRGIGPLGSAIFAREVQAVWPEQYPFADDRALRAAARLGLPDDPWDLAALVDGPAAFTELVAALVRCSLAHDEDGVLQQAAA